MMVLNDQMRRVANRQINRQGKVVRKLLAQHRRDIASLRKQLTQLHRGIKHMSKKGLRSNSPHNAAPAIADSGQPMRFRADGLKTHRAKLGLSAADYGKLVGVSGLTIYNWEAKKAKPRRSQITKVAAIRGMGKREALKRLAEIQ